MELSMRKKRTRKLDLSQWLHASFFTLLEEDDLHASR